MLFTGLLFLQSSLLGDFRECLQNNIYRNPAKMNPQRMERNNNLRFNASMPISLPFVALVWSSLSSQTIRVSRIFSKTCSHPPKFEILFTRPTRWIHKAPVRTLKLWINHSYIHAKLRNVIAGNGLQKAVYHRSSKFGPLTKLKIIDIWWEIWVTGTPTLQKTPKK